jgi:hypothetical protein
VDRDAEAEVAYEEDGGLYGDEHELQGGERGSHVARGLPPHALDMWDPVPTNQSSGGRGGLNV